MATSARSAIVLLNMVVVAVRDLCVLSNIRVFVFVGVVVLSSM